MAMRPSTNGRAWPSSAFLLVATLACCTRVHAQIYELSEVNMPGKFTLQTHYYFFITSSSDASAGGGEGRLGGATVNFKDLRVTPKDNEPSAPLASKLAGYSSVQVSLIPLNKFWNIIDSDQFCDGNKLHFKGGEKHDEVVTFNVGADAASHTADLKLSGPYALTITNCGDLTGLAITGSVEVKNPWGFLPATEFNKKAFFAGVAVFYAITALVWTAVALQWWKQLYAIQKVLTATVWICVVESVTGWAELETWNSGGGGSGPSSLFLMTTLAFTWKAVAMFEMLMFSPQKGAVEDISLKGHAALLAFMVAVFNFKVVLAFRNCHNIQMERVCLNAVPVVMIFATLVAWTQSNLGAAIEMLEEQKDQKKMAMYQKLRIVAGVGALGAGLCGALQILDPTVADHKLWGYHFLPSEGAFQILFAVLLSTCMVICLPSQDAQSYDYAVAQVEGETIGAPNSVWDDEDCEEAKNEPANKSGDDLMPVE
mmetsp:Transcript_79646/g.258129  ORF Transcript_79646/g.258129 Transcript_79646/m.258129 type:complete len:484 (-) Transcript_79646:269-1720(-)